MKGKLVSTVLNQFVTYATKSVCDVCVPGSTVM
jgi:hypothetical protein